jgi:hypothetical protein
MPLLHCALENYIYSFCGMTAPEPVIVFSHVSFRQFVRLKAAETTEILLLLHYLQ